MGVRRRNQGLETNALVRLLFKIEVAYRRAPLSSKHELMTGGKMKECGIKKRLND